MTVIQVEDATERIKGDYGEMPGLTVTFWQAQRLWNLPEDLCERALHTLTVSGYLMQARDGSYRLRHPEHSGLLTKDR